MRLSLSASRPFDFCLALGVPLVLMAFLLLIEPDGLDFALARLFYEPGQGFIGRHNFWLEDILHGRAKELVKVLGVLIIVGFLLSLLPGRLGYLVLALGLSTAVVTPLKALTDMDCPWSLKQFGGEEIFTPLLSERAPSLKPGRCWPGATLPLASP